MEELQAADLLAMAEGLPQGLSALHSARPDAIPVQLPNETTQVWHGTNAEKALAAVELPAADLPVVDLPVVDVPVARAGEQTLIIRRPVRRKRIDWRAPIGLAGSSVVLVVMLAVADWSQRHPVIPPIAPVSARSETAPPVPLERTPSQPIVEALADAQATRDSAASSDSAPAERAERTGRRASKSSVLARGDAGRAAAKPRTRPSGASGARGNRVPPTSNDRRPTKDDDAASSSGSAMAHSTRARSSRSTGLTSSAWVDPFAAY